MWIYLCVPQSMYKKIYQNKISSMGLNVLEFFCVSLYTEFLSDLYIKFQVASIHDTNVEYQIWCFCCILFLSYANNRHTETRTETHIHTHIHIDHLLKMCFSYSGDLKTCNSIKISALKQQQYFLYLLVRECKKTLLAMNKPELLYVY